MSKNRLFKNQSEIRLIVSVTCHALKLRYFLTGAACASVMTTPKWSRPHERITQYS